MLTTSSTSSGRRGRAAATGARLGPPAERALRRTRCSARHPARPGRTDRPARRRPSLHRARLPAGDARRRWHPAGRLRAGALAALEPRLRRSGCRRTPTAPASTSRASGSRSPRGRRRARSAAKVLLRAHARRAAARVLPPHRLPAAAARVGLRLLEEPRRLRAPGRRARRLRRLPAPPHPARRDRDRLALGDAVQHVGVQPAPVPRRRRDGRDDARRRRAHRGVGDAVGEPRLERRADPAPARVRAPAPRAGPELRSRRRGRPFRHRARRRAVRDPVVDGNGLARRLHQCGGRGVVALAGQGACSSSASRGSRPTTATVTTSPIDVRLADGRTGAQAAWALGGLHRREPAARARRGSSRHRRPVRSQRLDRPAGDRAHVGRRPGVGLLVAAGARGRDAVSGRERLLELVPRRRRLPRPPARRALPP